MKTVKVKEIFVINISDTKTDDKGNLVMKRKYGKFNRPVIKLK